MSAEARTAGLIVLELDEETLVYDLERHRAHCLNPVAALVWRCCDGTATPAGIAVVVGQRLGIRLDPEVVSYAVASLRRAHLLEETSPAERPRAWSRREALRSLTAAGVGAALLPAVTSIVSPTLLEAQGGSLCLPAGSPCEIGITLPCCEGLRCQGPPPGMPSTCR